MLREAKPLDEEANPPVLGGTTDCVSCWGLLYLPRIMSMSNASVVLTRCILSTSPLANAAYPSANISAGFV